MPNTTACVEMPQPPRSFASNHTSRKGDLAPTLYTEACHFRGVCAHLVQYDRIVSMPPRKAEVKMLQALVGQEAFAKCAEGAAEAATLVRDVRYLRHTCRRSTRHHPNELVLSVYGFSKVCERDIVLRLMRYALQPRLIWAAEVGSNGSGKWEALLVLDVCRWPISFVFGEREALVEVLEKVFARCKQSIGIFELPSWTDPSTVTALQRLQAGREKWGNLLCAKNNIYLLQHEVTVLLRERENERAQVRQHTNLYFNADNMLYLLREVRAAHVALEQTRNFMARSNQSVRLLENEMQETARHIAYLQSYLLEITTALDGVEMPQVQPRMQALRQAFVRQMNMSREIQSDLNRALSETALSPPNIEGTSARNVEIPSPPTPAYLDPLTSPPLGPAPLAPVRFLRMGPHVSLRVLPRPPAIHVGGVQSGRGSGDSHDPIEVD